MAIFIGFGGNGGQLTDRPRVRRVLWLLFAVTLASAALVAIEIVQNYSDMRGLVIAPGRPFGDDFINLWTVALLIKSGGTDAVYLHKGFEQFQQALAGEYVGDRLWAYPPHSLFFAAPFAHFSYVLAFLLWSGLGLAALAAGARRLSFGWIETAILVFSPASMLCVLHGQSGNLVGGLLLFALSGTKQSVRGPALMAALLTVKPQAGFLLPVLWLLQRRWTLIAGASALALGLIGLSIAMFGATSWLNYFGDTLPALSLLETQGSGTFMYMIPSVFMSMRLLGFAAADAFATQMVFSGVLFAVLLWRLVVVKDPTRQTALLLLGTCLITPYLHVYDMTILLAPALLLLRDAAPTDRREMGLATAAVLIAWVLPRLVLPLGATGLPISPLLMLAVFIIACFGPRYEALPATRQVA